MLNFKNGSARYFECYVGTRQGCISSPIMFSPFINELVSCLQHEYDGDIFVTNQIQDLFALMLAADVAS